MHLIVFAPWLVKALNLLLLDIITRFVPCKTIKSCSHDKAWFKEWSYQAYRDKHPAYNLSSANRTRPYVAMQNIADNVYKEPKSEYNTYLKEVISEASQPHKWWSTHKSFLL